MRRLIGSLAAVVVSCLLVVSVGTPAVAMPGPNREEWWFHAFGIQDVVWPLTTGTGVTVGLIDSGVNSDLPDFNGSVILPGADFKGTGTDGTTDTDTKSGHGTAMASLIAAQGTGPSGWVGIAPGVKILSVVSAARTPESEARAIRYAVDHGAKVINMSHIMPWVTDPDNCPREALEASAYAARHDVVLVASAGNFENAGNIPGFPASCPGVLAVGAYDRLLNPWKDTQRQSYVSLAGPGFGVGYIGKDGRLYHSGSGTSMAAALVSGAVALIRSRFPDESARQVVARILATVTDLGPPGWDAQMGYGALSLRKALTQSVPANAPNPVYDRLDKALAAEAKTASPSAGAPAAEGGGRSSGLRNGLLLAAAMVLVAGAVVIAMVVTRRRPAVSSVRLPVPPGPAGPFPPGQDPHLSGPAPSAGSRGGYPGQEPPHAYGSHQDGPG